MLSAITASSTSSRGRADVDIPVGRVALRAALRIAAVRKRVAIACQGGGSRTAFTAGVLDRLCGHVLDTHELVGLSGTSGGAVCALLAWDALRAGDPAAAGRSLEAFWADASASSPWEQLLNASAMLAGKLQPYVAMPAISPYDNVLAGSAAEEFKAMLRRRVDFDRVEPVPEEPVLVTGAVDVLSGEFRSKLNRDPVLINDLIALGRAQADEFLIALAFESAWRERNSEAVLGFFADDVELISTEPFPQAGPTRGISHVDAFVDSTCRAPSSI